MTDTIGQTHYALVADVRERMAGTGITYPTNYDGVFDELIDGVSSEFNRCVSKGRGCKGPWSFIADSVASERIYNARRGFTDYLPIEDCVQITQVRLVAPDGSTLQILNSPQDYWPATAGPIVGLWRVGGQWPQATVAAVGVTARWGFSDTLMADVTKQTVTEVIREFLASKAGEPDSVGYGGLSRTRVSKDFTPKTNDLFNDYSYGGAHLRGG